MGAVLFLDIAPKFTGYCVGDGSQAPVADAWSLIRSGDDYGALADELETLVFSVVQHHDVVAAAYESPILRRHDALHDLRRIYGLGMVFELTCRRIAQGRGKPLPCSEIDLRKIKTFATGDPWAEKKDVAAAVVAAGIPLLPRTAAEGRYDAGDAAAGWAILLEDHDPAAASPWISRFRGTLL